MEAAANIFWLIALTGKVPIAPTLSRKNLQHEYIVLVPDSARVEVGCINLCTLFFCYHFPNLFLEMKSVKFILGPMDLPFLYYEYCLSIDPRLFFY